MPLYELFRSFSNSELEMIEEQVGCAKCGLQSHSHRYTYLILLVSCINDARRYWNTI